MVLLPFAKHPGRLRGVTRTIVLHVLGNSFLAWGRPGWGARSPLEFDGQLWARIGTRTSMVRVEQGRPAYGQLWASRNLSVIPLGTEVMDASLPP